MHLAIACQSAENPNPPVELTPLTRHQQQLVERHCGLVALHIRRHARRLRNRRLGLWTDLYQEGCLGLIDAARTYPPQSTIPFPAYALYRIRGAIHRALQREWTSTRPHPAHFTDAVEDPSPSRRVLPRVVRAKRGLERALFEQALVCAIGQRIRKSAEQACQNMSRRKSSLPHRKPMIDLLMSARILVHDPRWKLSLRAIAKQTGMSMARVVKSEQSLLHMMRRILRRDAKFQYLRRLLCHWPNPPAIPFLRANAPRNHRRRRDEGE